MSYYYIEQSALINRSIGNVRDAIKLGLRRILSKHGQVDLNAPVGEMYLDLQRMKVSINADSTSLQTPIRCAIVKVFLNENNGDITFHGDSNGDVQAFDFNDLSTDDLAAILDAICESKKL